MKIGEIWCLQKLPFFTIWNIPWDSPRDKYTNVFKSYTLSHGDCFTVLEDLDPGNDIEFQLCILFNNQKWYLDVAKSSVKHGLFKKL